MSEEKHIPLCNKCASAEMAPGPVEGTKQIVGCAENPDIKSYADAEKMCPWLGEDKIVVEEDIETKTMVHIPLDIPKDLYLELYERGIRELPTERIVAAYAEWVLTQKMEELAAEEEPESE